MPKFLVALLMAPSLGLAARVKVATASAEPSDGKPESCPPGYVCTPASCDFPNSNGKPGLECACGDGYDGEVTWRLSSVNGVHYHTPVWNCEVVNCGILGTEGDGPDCKCNAALGLYGEIVWDGPKVSGECMFEAKELFTEGSLMTWNHDDKSIKCCVSSAGKETLLQNMNAELPKSGLAGGGRVKPSGCGFMFGESYHNGLKPYSKLIDMNSVSREEPTCPVRIEKLLEVAGTNLEAFTELLHEKRAPAATLK